MIDHNKRKAELLAAGFREHGPNMGNNYDALFQKRIRDEHGTRYFLDVSAYFYTVGHIGWQVEVNYNDGCAFCKTGMAMKIVAHSLGESWTVADIESWADELWTRLAPNYYERDE